MNKTTLIYLFSQITNFMINFDHGIIPACTREMIKDLNIQQYELGFLGSAVYAGLVLGSIVGSGIFNRISTKRIVVLSVIFGILSLSLVMTKSIVFLFISRFLVGFFQVFLVIFFPVWIDIHGGENKTLWLTFMQLTVALGAVSGYLAASLFVSHTGNWLYPYYLQIVLLVPSVLFYSIFCTADQLDTTGRQEKQENKNQEPFIGKLQILFNNPIFLFSMLTLSSLFFVVTGIQFWISDYLRIVLDMPQQFVFKAYLGISLTAPILGVTVGGILLHKIGGYDGKHALKLATAEALLASLCATPIPYLNDGTGILVLLWFLFFFGGSAVPAVTGIMICSIPKDQKSTGNSVSHLFQELLGYLPSPTIYGIVQNLTGGNESRYGMVVITSMSYFGVAFLILALVRNQKEETQLQKQVDFRELRKLTSIEQCQSALIQRKHKSIENSLDVSDIHNPLMFGRTAARQNSIRKTVVNVVSFIGRQSIDLDFGEPDDVAQNTFELKDHKVYLLSKGQYIDIPKK